MTYKELYLKEHPDIEGPLLNVSKLPCPKPIQGGNCPYGFNDLHEQQCVDCWNSEIPEEKLESRPFFNGTEVNFDGAEFQKKVYEALGFPHPVSPKEVADGMLADKSGAMKRSDIDKIIEDLDNSFKEVGEVAEKAEKALSETASTIKDSVPVYYACPHYDMVSKTCGDHMDHERCVCDGDMLVCDFFSEKREKAKQMVDAIDKTVNRPAIKDSGSRREFSTGAVRDIQEGKGRCDLMPLDVVGHLLFDDPFIFQVHEFTKDGDPEHLCFALMVASKGNGYPWDKLADMLLDAALHFEAGAKKYGEYNWQKGIPTKCYIDSAVRHYLKMCRGDKDEPHDRAFVWNILCCIWTCKHKPELNDYPRKETYDGK